MIREWQPVIQWISRQIEMASKENEIYSLWKALYTFGLGDYQSPLPPPPPSAAPTVVYVSGRRDSLLQVNGPFRLIEPDFEGAYITYETSSDHDEVPFQNGTRRARRILHGPDPSWVHYESNELFLRYITLCYLTPQAIDAYGRGIGKITLFTEGKPEMWMKSLLEKKKVGGLIGWERALHPSWEVNWICSYDEFEWAHLLESSIEEKVVREPFKLNLDIKSPLFGLKISLHRALQEPNEASRSQLWKETLDQAVAHLLDERWLKNPISIRLMLPIIMQKVQSYLSGVASVPAADRNVDLVITKIKDWSQREHTYVT